MLKNELNNLLQKPMDRRDFFKHVGVGVVAMTGAATLVKTLNTVSGGAVTSQVRTAGYGGGAYGGNKVAQTNR